MFDPETVERVALAIANSELRKLDLPELKSVDEFRYDGDQKDYLRLAQAALVAAFEWRQIETAPKDGIFLICGGGRMSIASGTILHIANLPDTPKHLSLSWATHWMPLPPPPEARDE